MMNDIQLFWRIKTVSSPENIVPNFLPFEFDFNYDLQLITQKVNKQILKYLNDIYLADSNIGYLQDTEFGIKYKSDFMKFIEAALNNHGKNVKSILEIGCGGCTILSDLKKNGYEVIGIDPSPISTVTANKISFRIINDFFPTELFKDKVDLIYHSDVLEHIPDPVTFLKNQTKQLSDNGLIIIAVPDSSESIALGDSSMALHQHINYFNKESLRNTINAAGLSIIELKNSEYGGSLYCSAKHKNNNSCEVKISQNYSIFTEKMAIQKTKIRSLVSLLKQDPHRSVGIYVPLRATPYLSDFDGIRFFDDTPGWAGNKLDGIDVKIENFESLLANPVTDLLIMTLTFDEIIRKKVHNISGIKNIITLRELLNE